MRATRQLVSMYAVLKRRISYFRECSSRFLSGNSRFDNAWGAHVVIELDNLIVCTFRELIVSSNLGTRGISGSWIETQVSPFSKDSELCAKALAIVNSVKYSKMGSPLSIDRREEHKFRSPREVRVVLHSLGATNLGALDTALSLNSNLFSEIAVLRNFYAHRNRDTWSRASTYFSQQRGFPRFDRASELLAYRRPGSTESVVGEWMFDFELFFEFALQ
jgi:hypothetical protein